MSNLKLFALGVVCLLLSACGTKRVVVDQQPPTTPSVHTTTGTDSPTDAEAKKPKHTDNLWHGIDYDGEPWVRNVSKPFSIARGLYNRHITVWPSHGRYYDQEKAQWKWQ